MKLLIFLILVLVISLPAVLCRSKPKTIAGNEPVTPKKDTVLMMAGINSKGIGRFQNIQLTHPLDQNMVNRGRVIYESKCFACHKLNKEMLVGPG